MRPRPGLTVIGCLMLCVVLWLSPHVLASEGNLWLLDRQALDAAKKSAARERGLAVAVLRKRADAVVNAGPFSVAANDITSPRGDKRDYMSVGTYWWPDPAKPDGLPYIRRDGKVNPQRKRDDSRVMQAMVDAMDTLSLAYFYTGDKAYAERAAKLLRVFFLDGKTGMRPHLNFAQAIPGRTAGRGTGIIDTRRLIQIPTARPCCCHRQRGAIATINNSARGLRITRCGCATARTGRRRRARRTTSAHGTTCNWLPSRCLGGRRTSLRKYSSVPVTSVCSRRFNPTGRCRMNSTARVRLNTQCLT